MANSEARGSKQPAPQVDGIEVTEATPADWIAANTPAAADAFNMRGEKVVKQNGAPPESWRLL